MGKRKVVAQAKLSDAEWARVFLICCKSRRGDPVSKEERALSTRAYKENRRYKAQRRNWRDGSRWT